MEDQKEDLSSAGLGPLFIREEKGDTDRTILEQSEDNQNPKGQSFTGKQVKQSALSKPYLQEMDVLLKNCERLTGIPFRSRHIEGYSEASPSKSSCNRSKEVRTETSGEACSSPQADASSCYIDTHMDGTETKKEWVECQNSVTVIHRPEMSCQSDMPLSSVGNNLSASMLEYEGQLMGMLAMLESCMEEAGMDFEPQDQGADASPEYVHISNRSHHHRGTKQMNDQTENPPLLPIDEDSCIMENDTSEDGVIGKTIESVRKGHPPDYLVGSSKEKPEKQGHLKVDLNPDFMFSDPQVPLEQANRDPLFSEERSTGHMFDEETQAMEEIVGEALDNTAEERYELKTDLELDMNHLRSQMEDCIEEVQQLEKRRKELLLEVLQLRGPRDKEQAEQGSKDEEETEESIDSKAAELIRILKKEEEGRREERKKEIQGLREEREEEERKTWKVNLERQGLQEEVRRMRRRLFAVARDCAQSQATLKNQRCDVELLRKEEVKSPPGAADALHF